MATTKERECTKLKKADIFGRTFCLNYGGESSELKTAFGGLLTLLAIVLIIPIIFIFARR